MQAHSSLSYCGSVGASCLQIPGFTDVQWSETQHELTRRITILVERNQLSAPTAQELLQTSFELAASNLILFEKTSYQHLEPKAKRRIARDPNDWQSVALALALTTGIWTNDKDFFGCGVATWSTETLIRELADLKIDAM